MFTSGAVARPPRRVAIVLHEPIIGGATIGVLRIVPLLEQRGWRCVFWAPGPGPVHDHLRALGHEVDGRPRLLRYSAASLRVAPGARARLQSVPGYLSAYRRWLQRHEPALVHANTLITIPEALVARTTGARVLLYVHEILPSGAKGRAAGALMRACAEVVLATSAASAAALGRAGVQAREILPGVALPPVPAPDRDDDRVVVGVLGTISRRKGSDLFLRAAERVRRELPRVELRMIGPLADGPEHEWARHVVARAQAAGIAWATTTDPFAELAGWDMLVLPSRVEPFGTVLIEAMAMGLPVVAARVGGVPDVVTADTGLLVEPEDADALATAILELAGDRARRQALGVAGRERVERLYTLEQQVDVLDRGYLDVAARGRRRRRVR